MPTIDQVATFSDPGNPIQFVNNAKEFSTNNTFREFFTLPVLTEFIAAGGNPDASMSTADGKGTTSTFIRITGSYSSASAFTGLIDHDDGGQIVIDGDFSTGVGTTFVCGNGNESSENSQPCNFPSGTHTFAILYTEDNGSPSILTASVPAPSLLSIPAPEPASLALLGVGVLGLGFVTAKRRN